MTLPLGLTMYFVIIADSHSGNAYFDTLGMAQAYAQDAANSYQSDAKIITAVGLSLLETVSPNM